MEWERGWEWKVKNPFQQKFFFIKLKLFQVFFFKLKSWELNSVRNSDMFSLPRRSESAIYRFETATSNKHCRRHNGPKGWVLLTKATSSGHITSSWLLHKSWSNFICRISTKHQLQNLNQTSTTLSTSTSFELPSSHARATSIKFTKQQSVSESVSEWVS